MGKSKILKAITSTALACVLTATSLVSVFAAEGTRTIERSTVQWAKTVRYNYPKGTDTVQFTQGLGFTMPRPFAMGRGFRSIVFKSFLC